MRPAGKFQLQRYGALKRNKYHLVSDVEDKLKVTTKHNTVNRNVFLKRVGLQVFFNGTSIPIPIVIGIPDS